MKPFIWAAVLLILGAWALLSKGSGWLTRIAAAILIGLVIVGVVLYLTDVRIAGVTN